MAIPKRPSPALTDTAAIASLVPVPETSSAPVPAPLPPPVSVQASAPVSIPSVSSTSNASTIPVTSTPHPAVAVPATPPASIPVPDGDLPSILRRLNPTQRAWIRGEAVAQGVIRGGTGTALGNGGGSVGGYRENPDGSVSVMIRVDGDLVPQLKTWAEEAGTPLERQIQEIVEQVLSSYLMSSWEAPPPTVAAPVAAAK